MNDVKSTRWSNWHWWVCGAMFLATVLNYMDRQALSQTATDLKERYHIGDARYGVVERNFSWAFAAGSILFGLVVDSFGPRLVYPFVLLGWSLAGLATPLVGDADVTRYVADPSDPTTGPYHWLLACRTMLGFFEAGHWPCALISARQILAKKDRPLGNGILQSGASIGAVLIPPYVIAVRHIGADWQAVQWWQVVFWTVGGVGLLWVPVWLALVRPGDLDRMKEERVVPPQLNDGLLGYRAWFAFIRMYLALFAIINGLAISWQFLRAWLPKYLKESQHFSADVADGIVACYYITAGVGCLASGVLVRWLVRRGRGIHAARVIGFAAFTFLTLAATLVPVVGSGWTGVGLLMLTAAGILGLHPCYYALAQELPTKYMGILSGLLAAMGWYVAGHVQKELGAHIEATGRYDEGLVLAGAAPLLGLLALVVLWRKPNPLS